MLQRLFSLILHLILPAGDKVSTADVAEGSVQRERDQDKDHVNRKPMEIFPYSRIETQLQKLPWKDF